jgi:type I restriction enzyme S subunit
MQSDWPLVRLGDHVDACLGKMLDAQKNKGEMQPYLGNVNVRWGAFDLSDLSEMRFEPHEEERYGLLPGDLVVCEGGEPGRCAVWTGPVQRMKIQKALHRIRPKASLDNYYLYYWFRHAAKVGLLDAHFTGTTIKHLTGKAIAALEVPLPPIQTQRASVDVLRRLDDRIDLLRQTNATLESIAQALFKSWFIDFDPVRAKAEGREPEGMDAATAESFSGEFQDSPLGPIPKGWNVGTFGDLATLSKGSVNPMDTPEAVFEHYSLPAFDAGELPVLEVGGAIKSNKTRVPAGSVLQSKLNPHIPRVWLPSRIGTTAVCSTEFLPWTAKAPASAEFIYCILSSSAFEAQVRTLVTGTSNSHQRVKPDQVAALSQVLPPAAVCSAFTDAVRPLLRKVGDARLQAKQLADIRDTLLPRLISGKLRLPEAQEQVEEAVA